MTLDRKRANSDYSQSRSQGQEVPAPAPGFSYTENRSTGLSGASQGKSCKCGRRIYAQREWCSVCNKKIRYHSDPVYRAKCRETNRNRMRSKVRHTSLPPGPLWELVSQIGLRRVARRMALRYGGTWRHYDTTLERLAYASHVRMDTADRICTALRVHPVNVWPKEWMDV